MCASSYHRLSSDSKLCKLQSIVLFLQGGHRGGGGGFNYDLIEAGGSEPVGFTLLHTSNLVPLQRDIWCHMSDIMKLSLMPHPVAII